MYFNYGNSYNVALALKSTEEINGIQLAETYPCGNSARDKDEGSKWWEKISYMQPFAIHWAKVKFRSYT